MSSYTVTNCYSRLTSEESGLVRVKPAAASLRYRRLAPCSVNGDEERRGRRG